MKGRLRGLPLRTAITIFLLSARLFALEPGQFYTDGPQSKNALALTFDDGPGLFTPQILELLDRQKVKATFFMNGDQVQIRPQIAKDVSARGHEIGDHTWSHVNFYAYEKKYGKGKTEIKIREEIQKSKGIIEKTCGTKIALLRMPNGFNPRPNRPWMKEIAKDFGVALVNWTFGEDWQKIPEEKMADDYLKWVKPGAILLFHDGGRGRGKTVRIVSKVIEKARAKGLEFVTAGELLR